MRQPAWGGVTRYPSDRLHEEVAYIAYHFNWSLNQIMSMDHAQRRRWVDEVARINTRLSED